MDKSELITDRTQDDINYILSLRANNQPLPFGDLRTSWDWRAFNRVELFTKQLAELLGNRGMAINITTKTNWTADSLATFETESARILGNINALRNAFHVMPTTPPPPGSIMNLSFSQANDIEQILYDMSLLFESMLLAFRHSGTFNAGMEGAVRA